MLPTPDPRTIATRRADNALPGLREPALAICLSGGGYRAMLFHVGALRRLNEFGLLSVIDRVSSVSGGSITAAAAARAWPSLNFGGDGVVANFELIEKPLFNLASHTIDISSLVGGLPPGRSPARSLAARYRRHLLGDASLRDLPDHPRFTFNTTNLSTGGLLRWSRHYAADHRMGSIFEPDVPLADVVAASSAFPPFLSPLSLRPPGPIVDHNTRAPVVDPPAHLVLTDGGVYDNLGLQAVESFHTVLASNGGSPLDYNARPRRNWLSQSLRTLHVIDGQVRSLRQRQFVRELTAGQRRGALWTITTDIRDFPAAGVLAVADGVPAELSGIRTRLAALPEAVRKRLVNWGYALADAAIRSYVEPSFPLPTGYPYPEEDLGT
jgi:NTE family protein